MKSSWITVIIAGLVTCSSSFAKDSLWGLGDDNKVAINLFEHRAGAGSRATEVTLIIGSWFLVGQVKDTGNGYPNPSPITLTTKNGTFKGTISLDFAAKKSGSGPDGKVKLKGKLTLQGTPYNLDETIPYKILTGL